jgi:hypothetical protein
MTHQLLSANEAILNNYTGSFHVHCQNRIPGYHAAESNDVEQSFELTFEDCPKGHMFDLDADW